MRILLLGAMIIGCSLVPASAQQPETKPREAPTEAIFQELLAGFPKDGKRTTSARLELEYWHEESSALARLLGPPVRKALKTKDGKAAEVVFLSAPSMSIPGTDFSMAFLLVEKHVVDWASCWTYNRTANQELLLEDVDGDGVLDVAFRASDGWHGLLDKRQHSRPGDKRKWLYAYAVTTKGFQSLFPDTRHDLNMKLSYDTADQPIRLQVKGLPESLRERQMVECTLSATNTSDKEIAIKPGEWFSVNIDKAGLFMTYSPPDKRAVLKSGETVSQVIRLFVHGTEKEVTMRWKFVPNR